MSALAFPALGLAALLWLTAAMLGAIASPRRGRSLVYGLSALGAFLGVFAGLGVLFQGAVLTQSLPLGLPGARSLLRLDALSGFFLAVVDGGGVFASLAALSLEDAEPRRVSPFFPLFLGAMSLTLLAADSYTFLLGWEGMSVASWALVVAEPRREGTVEAGYVYLMMASAGTLALLAAFVLLGIGGRLAPPPLAPGAGALALALTLVTLGTTSKAGLVPLHVWLPLAHPAAPSQVSALMSGVMTKVAVYAFLRLVFDVILPTGAAPINALAGAIILLGVLSALHGVLSALMQHDLKRLLAFHTVENIGIIFLGIGFALLFEKSVPAAAALALAAALFHVLNHALFKTLLFLGAGVVRESAGSADMEKLGGLIHRAPRLAFAFLIGTMAISALPPLNGFVSEWLAFQAMLQTPRLGSSPLALLGPLAAAALALAAALAAACFVKAYGITFLGRARSPRAGAVVEAGRAALAALFGLAALCVIFGILPGPVLRALGPVVTGRLGSAGVPQVSLSAGLSVSPIPGAPPHYAGLALGFALAIFMLLPALLLRRRGAPPRRGPAWDCGFPDPSPATQYSAGGFAAPIRRVFGPLVFAARERVEMPPPGALTPAHFEVRLRDLVWEGIYRPPIRLVLALADRLNPLQFLTVRRYLGIVFGLLAALLLVVALWT